MSVAMTNCGALRLGQRSHRLSVRPDRSRQRKTVAGDARALFFAWQRDAAAPPASTSFAPDACLINRYEPGAKLSLHQDKDERDFAQPIVSVSLGLPAIFLFGGLKRSATDDARAARAWRRRRLGRAGAPQLPRRIADQGSAPSIRRRASHQSYVAPGGLRFPQAAGTLCAALRTRVAPPIRNKSAAIFPRFSSGSPLSGKGSASSAAGASLWRL